jgi:cysteine dioxygenase
MARRVIGVDDLVERLKAFESEIITRDRVLDYLEGVRVGDAALERYVMYDSGFYTRNLIYRDALFEVMTICWEPGQKTAIHTHNGQLCWMVPQRGTLEVVDYKWLGCDHPENQNVVGIDCLAGGQEIDLDEVRRVDACGGGTVLTADKIQTIHRIANEGGERAVSIHIYSQPIDSCVAFDMVNRRCYRRVLAYHSKYGEVQVETVAPARSLPVVGS